MVHHDRDTMPVPMSGTDRHRQHGEGSVPPQGAIVAKKKGDWAWWVVTVALVAGVILFIYW